MLQVNQLTKNGKSPTTFKVVATTLFGIGTLLSSAILPTQVAAQSDTADLYDGGKARVNRSAGLRALSEAVASASCRLGNGIDTDTSQQALEGAVNQFNAILAALENGNATLGIPTVETRARTLTEIENTVIAWAPIAAPANRMASGEWSDDDLQSISGSYAALFDQTVVLAAEISGQYSNPQELLQSDATVLNFAGRQRALAQRMSRAMCELATGTGTDGTVDELIETVDLFERTLAALISGFPAAGITEPPNDTVTENLELTLADWQEGRGLFDGALAGEEPSIDDVIATVELTDKLTVDMNNTITLYLIASPGKDGIYRVPLEAYIDDELSNWLANPALIDAIKEQNIEHANLTEDEVIALDQEWRAEAGAGGGALITELLEHPVSEWLRGQQTATAGFVTEVFVMDNKGLNVAQSAETSDYWQGDEAKWQETYQVGPDTLHISEVEFDDSTGFYQVQASLSISDPDTNGVIGAVTFGINIQNLM